MPEPEPPDPLRLAQCPRCGYSLEGLPDEGKCPECGRPYDQSVVIFHGWSRGSQADIATARPWVVIVVALAVAWLVWTWLRDAGQRDPTGLICSAVVVGFLCVGLWRRWSSPLPAPVQVRLSAEGCCQLNNPRNLRWSKFEPWDRARDILIESAAGGRTRLRFVYRIKWWEATLVPVDAEVVCSPEQAAALRRRIESWRTCSAPAALQ